jgi:cytochrome c biogenesis protein
MKGLRRLGSLRLTLWGFGLLALGLAVHQVDPQWGVWPTGLPLGLLAINLASALAVDPRLRRTQALYVFHLCLLLLAFLAAWGQLARYEGRVNLVEGQHFDPRLLATDAAGPWARPRPSAEAFVQQDVVVDYAPGIARGGTRSRVRLADGTQLEIGDHVPLVVSGFRFYSTSNKGFAVLLQWLPVQGSSQLGAVQFPSFPIKELTQETEWQTPAGQTLELSLALPVLPADNAWQLSRLLAADRPLSVEVAANGYRLSPGDSLVLEGGRVRFVGTAMWLGYRVSHNPALPWLFSAAILALGAMAWHLGVRWRRMAAPQRLPIGGRWT